MKISEAFDFNQIKVDKKTLIKKNFSDLHTRMAPLSIYLFICNNLENAGLFIYDCNDKEKREAYFKDHIKIYNNTLYIGDISDDDYDSKYHLNFSRIKLFNEFLKLCIKLHIRKIMNLISIAPYMEDFNEFKMYNSGEYITLDGTIDFQYITISYAFINEISDKCNINTLLLKSCIINDFKNIKINANRLSMSNMCLIKDFSFIKSCKTFYFTIPDNFSRGTYDGYIPSSRSMKGLPDGVEVVKLNFGSYSLMHTNFNLRYLPESVLKLKIYLGIENLGKHNSQDGARSHNGFCFKYFPVNINDIDISADDIDKGFYYRNTETWGRNVNKIPVNIIKKLLAHKIYYIEYDGNYNKREILNNDTSLYEAFDFNQINIDKKTLLKKSFKNTTKSILDELFINELTNWLSNEDNICIDNHNKYAAFYEKRFKQFYLTDIVNRVYNIPEFIVKIEENEVLLLYKQNDDIRLATIECSNLNLLLKFCSILKKYKINSVKNKLSLVNPDVADIKYLGEDYNGNILNDTENILGSIHFSDIIILGNNSPSNIFIFKSGIINCTTLEMRIPLYHIENNMVFNVDDKMDYYGDCYNISNGVLRNSNIKKLNIYNMLVYNIGTINFNEDANLILPETLNTLTFIMSENPSDRCYQSGNIVIYAPNSLKKLNIDITIYNHKTGYRKLQGLEIKNIEDIVSNGTSIKFTCSRMDNFNIPNTKLSINSRKTPGEIHCNLMQLNNVLEVLTHH